jgi:predicted phage baseplate assembly protein
VINLLRLIGYELRPPQPASADLTLLFEDAEEPTTARIKKGAEFETTRKATGEPIRFQYLREDLELVIQDMPLKEYEDGKEAEQYRWFETLPVVQVDASESDEILGSSEGSAGQRFPLARTPLIDGTLEVMVDEGAGPVLWERQPTLLYSLSGDRHYVVRRDEHDVAWIEFGDAKYGRIPPRGRNNITAVYRVGGGTKGNVPAHTIAKARADIDLLEHVFNEKPATGGAEAESSAEAVKRGPGLFRATGRAVTARDYEAFAREFGVGKVRARAAGWNRVDLFVAPIGGGLPSDTLRDNLRAYLEDKRMVTSIVEVQDPSYVKVYVEGNLEVEPYFYTEHVQQRVENAVRDLLAFENVQFGGRLYASKIYEAIEAIEGVAGVTITFARAEPLPGEPAPPPCPEGVLCFGWHEIPIAAYGAGIKLVDVRGGHRAR